MTIGTVGNPDRWEVVFVDANQQPVDPDGPVTFTITRNGRTIHTETQELGAAVGPGTFALIYTPEVAHAYRVKASATVAGTVQATPAVSRGVTA